MGDIWTSRDFVSTLLSEAGGTRTRDQRIKSPLLYRLSYSPNNMLFYGDIDVFRQL